MLTTLTSRALAGFTVSYKFFNKKIHIFIDTAADHELFGDVNIILTNAQLINLYTSTSIKIDDFFNGSKIFKAITKRRLEFSMDALNGLPESEQEITLPNNGSAITAQIDNLEVIYPNGHYTTKLISDPATVFDGALVTLQEQDIVNVEDPFNGIIDSYDEVSGETYQSIDNQELTFNYSFKLSVSTPGAATNIPISFIKD